MCRQSSPFYSCLDNGLSVTSFSINSHYESTYSPAFQAMTKFMWRQIVSTEVSCLSLCACQIVFVSEFPRQFPFLHVFIQVILWKVQSAVLAGPFNHHISLLVQLLSFLLLEDEYVQICFPLLFVICTL